ncbi:MAG: hydroxyisourate hydrolase [Pseudanabaenaceae cyanobacterium bins.39]|nr:hydroxyisourate hydrolase [Pseudanabaenaceae cyanobacterium bins.39]
MAGKLSTHVLDTVHGCPARNVKLELWAIANDQTKTLRKTLYTNQDGRTDQLLLDATEMQVGIYEIWFYVNDYFASWEPAKSNSSDLTFLGIVPIRFAITNASESYHVPLLVSPWSYSTYRGS